MSPCWIDNHNGPRFAFCFKRLFSKLLETQVKRVNTLYPGSGGVISFSEVFRPSLSKVSLYSPCLPVSISLNVCSSPRVLGFRPERFVIVDNAVGIRLGLASVADNWPAPVRSDKRARRAGVQSHLCGIYFDLFVLQLVRFCAISIGMIPGYGSGEESLRRKS